MLNENLGSIMGWKYPELKVWEHYEVRDQGSGIELRVIDTEAGVPTIAEAMAFELDYLAYSALEARNTTVRVEIQKSYSLEQQIDALLTGATGGRSLADMKSDIAAIKAANPKP